MATVHGTPPTIYERVRGWVSLAGLVSRVCPGGPYLAQWTVMGHNLWGHDSTILDVATIILNQWHHGKIQEFRHVATVAAQE